MQQFPGTDYDVDLPVFATAWRSLIDALRFVRETPILVSLTMIVFAIYQSVFLPNYLSIADPLSSRIYLLGALNSALVLAIVTPVLVRASRFYACASEPRDGRGRYRSYLVYFVAAVAPTLVLYAVMATPTALVWLFPLDMTLELFGLAQLAMQAAMMAGVYLAVRVCLAYPAIAIGSNTPFADSFEASSGHFWRILAILFVTAATVWIPALLVYFAIRSALPAYVDFAMLGAASVFAAIAISIAFTRLLLAERSSAEGAPYDMRSREVPFG